MRCCSHQPERAINGQSEGRRPSEDNAIKDHWNSGLKRVAEGGDPGERHVGAEEAVDDPRSGEADEAKRASWRYQST